MAGAGAESAGSAAGTPLPTEIKGVSVAVNGLAAPLLYVSPTQINAQAPFEIPQGAATVVVSVGGVAGSAVTVDVAAVGPGVWTLLGSARTLAVIALINAYNDLNTLGKVYYGNDYVASGATVNSGTPTANDATHFGFNFSITVGKAAGIGF